uniref:Uncharacterized protein n=1 Tax=Anguilla anguilla TaxID=7936 RepID=A0A0E9W4B2_ANGAN
MRLNRSSQKHYFGILSLC